MLAYVAITLSAAGVTAPRLINGGFEEGLAGWTTGHTWYEQPAGAGLSEIAIAEDEGRDGGAALRITGGG